ncbi:MAG: Dinitrogenase iron-molybdenum cofactor [bacterium ADurb.Bin429]|nr:MAG: Dinitrogenase iron-molybdenum cofactor [bacterium ADurb.Bin429]
MKIAVPAVDREPTAMIDARFGRAPWFLVYDTETQAWEAVANTSNLQTAQGAGIQSAETIARRGVAVVLAPHCGPKAFRVLQAAGVTVHLGVSGTVNDALTAYQAGQLPPAVAADVEGHW